MSLQIRLYNEWRGNYPNAVIEVNDNVGKALIEQNIGELYVKPKIKKVSIKQIDKAPRDRMLRGASNKRIIK
jgi:hypothetical protein